MKDEKVEVHIGSRQLVVEMPDLFPTEIAMLAERVSKRMTELQAENNRVADTSKIALLTALSFAADLERINQANGSSVRSCVAGRIIELASPTNGGENFRAMLSQEEASPIRILIPGEMINLICRAFSSGQRVSLTGRTLTAGEASSFSVEEVALSA